MTVCQKRVKSELLSLRNVGPAICEDLNRLGIERIAQLKTADPDELYARLQKLTGHHHDPCVWDVFAAIIDEAKTGVKKDWWYYSSIRKERQRKGNF